MTDADGPTDDPPERRRAARRFLLFDRAAGRLYNLRFAAVFALGAFVMAVFGVVELILGRTSSAAFTGVVVAGCVWGAVRFATRRQRFTDIDHF